jgi:hypothetical protein
MPLPIYRLRRWLVAAAVIFTVVVAAMYFSARLRERNVLREVPGKLGFDIKQTANGFQFSKSEAGRTVFTIRARNVKEFKLNGHADLKDVNIVLYGRDSSRFDQISGDNFAYDPKSGDVIAQGEVQIDLEANPEGTSNLDQAAPKALKNPIHLKTSDLVFNKDSGNATTDARLGRGRALPGKDEHARAGLADSRDDGGRLPLKPDRHPRPVHERSASARARPAAHDVGPRHIAIRSGDVLSRC